MTARRRHCATRARPPTWRADSDSSMRVLVTRPAGQADTWVRALAARGADAVALPLIDIAAPHDPAPVQAAWRALGDSRLAAFVSPNAARAFSRPGRKARPGRRPPGRPPSDRARPRRCARSACRHRPSSSRTRTAAVRFRGAVAAAGERDDWRGAHVLVVRGDGGATGWRRCGGQGRGRPPRSARRAALRRRVRGAARLQPGASRVARVALQCSREAITYLMHAPQPAAGADWPKARAIATHPRIASPCARARLRSGARVPAHRRRRGGLHTIARIVSELPVDLLPPPPPSPVRRETSPVPASTPSRRWAAAVAVVLLAPARGARPRLERGAAGEDAAGRAGAPPAGQRDAGRRGPAAGSAGSRKACATSGAHLLMESRMGEVSLQRGQLEELIQSLSRSRDENVLVDIEAGVRVAVQGRPPSPARPSRSSRR